MKKIKKVILATILGGTFAFGIGATINSFDNGAELAGCHGHYANGVGEIVACD